MSDLEIILSNGKDVHFNVLEDGWLGANVSETILHIEHPIPDLTGRKPSRVFRADQDLSVAEWVEIDLRLEYYFTNAGYSDTLFGFGRVDKKTENLVEVYNAKTNKSLAMFFVGNEIVDTVIISGRE